MIRKAVDGDHALLIIHGLVAVALLGAITHQTLAAWAPARGRPGSFFGRFRAVPPASFANAVVVLYVGRRAARRNRVFVFPRRHQARLWSAPATGRRWASSTSRSISSPSGWRCCRPTGFAGGGRLPTNSVRTRAALTAILAFIVWWSFLIGHVVNNIRDFGS